MTERTCHPSELGRWGDDGASPDPLRKGTGIALNPVEELHHHDADSREMGSKLHSIAQHLEEVHDHDGHSRCVYSICFSPDGQLVLTGSADKTAKLWSYHTRVSASPYSSLPPPAPSARRSPKGPR